MRICFVGNATSIHVQRWAAWFAQNGHDVHIISFWDAEIKGVTIHHIKLLPSILMSLKNSIARWKSLAPSGSGAPTQKATRGFRSALMAYFTLISQPVDNWRVRRIVKRMKPDILHGHYVTNYGFYAACSGFHPLVISAWGSDVLLDPGMSRSNRHKVEFTLNKADLITCDGDNSTEAMIKLGIEPEKINRICWGVDADIFSPDKKDGTLLCDLELGGSPVVVSVRSLNPVYDVETLVKVVPLVIAQVPESRFIVGGNGTQAAYLKRLSQSLGIAGNIRFVGEIPPEDMPKYLASADIYVSTALSDGGVSTSTTEAMACELPVVVTDSGDNRRWVKDGVNGFIVPPRSPEAIASKIVYLLHNKDERQRFGRINRRIVIENWNYNKEMAKMEKLYRGLVKEFKA